MTDEEAMEALLNSDGYSFPTWTLKLTPKAPSRRPTLRVTAATNVNICKVLKRHPETEG